MRPDKHPLKDVSSPVTQNEIVYQPSRMPVISRRLLVMLPLALAIFSFTVVATARYDGSVTLLHYNDLDGEHVSLPRV